MASKSIPSSVSCPTCGGGSSSIERITGGKTLTAGIAFGILAANTLKPPSSAEPAGTSGREPPTRNVAVCVGPRAERCRLLGSG